MKNTFKLFCLAILFSSASSNAQTYVSGFISANTTWNVAGSPYIVTGNALVSQGYTLTIDPGVVIKFDTNLALQIDGQLIAIGTAQNRITFTSNKVVPVPGDWAALHIADNSFNAVYDANGKYLSGTILKYCDVSYAGSLGYGAIHIESASPYISKCNIRNSASAGVYCIGSSCLIDSSAVKHCAAQGLYFDKISQNSCGLTIVSDTIENNGTGGIIVRSDPSCTTLIKNNYFYLNGGSQTLAFKSFSPYSNITIDNLTITGNSFIKNFALDNGIVYAEGNNHLIEKNIFTNDSGAALANILFTHGDNHRIIQNSFRNNYSGSMIINSDGNNHIIKENLFINDTTLSTSGTILATSGSYNTIECNLFLNNQSMAANGILNVGSWGYGSVRNNIFEGNRNLHSSGISISVSSYGSSPTYFTNNKIRNNSSAAYTCRFFSNINNQQLLHIDQNDFTNNTAKGIVYLTGALTNNSNLNFLYFKKNNFNNPNAQYEFYNDILYGSPNLYPDSNYWGSTSLQHIDSVIYDYFDLATKSVVYYQPILTSPVLIDTTCSYLLPADISSITDAFNSHFFPNPFSTYSTITFKEELKDASLLMYNVFGQRVKAIEHINANRIRIERANLVGGLYIYEVVEKQRRIATGKLVVE